MKYEKDESGEIEKIFKKVIKKEFPELACLRFVYVWVDKKRFDEDCLIIAQVCKIPNRERDLWGYDIRVEVHTDSWNDMTRAKQRRLSYHELLHVELDFEDKEDEESGELSKGNTVKVDKEDRICFHLNPHDLVVMRFKAELKRYGLTQEEEDVRRFLNEVHKTHKQEVTKKGKKSNKKK